jgi:predicted ATPase
MSVDCKNAAVQTRYLESQIQNSNDDDISQIKTLIWNIREQCTREEAPTYISNSGQKIYVRNGDGSVHYMNKENTTIVQQQLKPGEKRHHKSLKEVQE